MASKRKKRRDAERGLPPLSDKTGMTSEQLLAHRELEAIRSGYKGKRRQHLRKVRLLDEARKINAARKTQI